MTRVVWDMYPSLRSLPTYHKVPLDYVTKSKNLSRPRSGIKVSWENIPINNFDETIKARNFKKFKRFIRKVSN